MKTTFIIEKVANMIMAVTKFDDGSTDVIDVYKRQDQDGTKTINFSFSINIDITWSGVHNGVINSSANVKLPSIPRVTTPTLSVSSVEMGQSVMIKMERATSKFTHKLKFKLGKREIDIADNLGVSYTWQVPLSLANYIPNATSQKGVVVCETYLAGDFVGSKSVYLTLSVPKNITPVSYTHLDVYKRQTRGRGC